MEKPAYFCIEHDILNQMITENALVIYKNKPALVKEKADGKYSISLADGTQVKVRDKDIELLHPGPAKNFGELERSAVSDSSLRETWELLSDEYGGSYLTLKDLASFIFNEYTPSSTFASYTLLQDGLYFTGTINEVTLRSSEEIEASQAKRGEKQRDLNERSEFLDKLKTCLKKPDAVSFSSEDARFFQDVEALAMGKSIKSRTMRDIFLGETPEDAHSLLLKTGFWTKEINPHPSRFGVSLNSPIVCPDPPPQEERRDLCRLASFAIDSPWSSDPDDAVSIELEDGSSVIYVHVADVASSVAHGSPVEKEARDRGCSLYLPETTVRMLAEEALPIFALGLSEKSLALTFKITIDEKGDVKDTEIFPSVVKVRRMSYEEADKEMEASATEDAKALCALYALAQKIFKRRCTMGAVNIELPEAHISVKDGSVNIQQIVHHKSAFMVRECMIIAGEAAGTWAAGKGLVFPFLCQETEISGPIHEGMAGSMQMRKGMRPRFLSTKPGRHMGLGLDTYTQVTSPLRRYTDLLAHIQIRAFLRGEKPLSADDVMARLGAGEASSSACSHAERSSRAHWIMVYLSGKKDSVWDAVALENKGSRWAVIIPSIALEAQVPLGRDVSPNDNVKLVLKSVNIPKGEASFTTG